jgi:hypothetical protein
VKSALSLHASKWRMKSSGHPDVIFVIIVIEFVSDSSQYGVCMANRLANASDCDYFSTYGLEKNPLKTNG